jgi:hypothetical protein
MVELTISLRTTRPDGDVENQALIEDAQRAMYHHVGGTLAGSVRTSLRRR